MTDTSRSGDLVEVEIAEYAPKGGPHVMIWVNKRRTDLGGYCIDGVPREVAPVIVEALEASVTGLTHQRDFLRESLNLSDQRIEALSAENERIKDRLGWICATMDLDDSVSLQWIYAELEVLRGLGETK